MKLRAARLLLVATCLALPGRALAEETIFDPENPAFDSDEAAPEDSDESGEETIFDPENEEFRPDADALEESETTPPAALDRVQFTGDWSTGLRLDTHWNGGEEDVVEVPSQFGLRLEYDATENFRVVVGGQIRHWMAGKENLEQTDVLVNASDVRADLDLRLGEAYVLGRSGAWSLAVGNLVTRWGATDLTRPGDVVNPVDLTDLGSSAGTRLPQPTADLSFSGNGWGWQALLVPFFVGDDVWLIGRDSAFLNSENTVVAESFPVADLTRGLLPNSAIDDIQPILSAGNPPDETPKNVSLGTRFTATFANTDAGIGYFYGWDRQAFFDLDPAVRTLLVEVANDESFLDDFDAIAFFVRNTEAREAVTSITEKAQNGETLFESRHERLQTLTADLARYVGPIGVRADVAFQPAKTYFTQNFDSVRRPTLSAALGLSWEHLESEDDLFTVTVEGFMVRPFAHDDGVTQAFVDEDQRGSEDDELLLFGDLSAGVAGAIVWTVPLIDATLQLGGRSDLTHPDLVFTAELTRDLSSSLSMTLGAVVFEGPALDESFSIGGLYDADDAVFVRLNGLL